MSTVMTRQEEDMEYAGFLIRLCAYIIDGLLYCAVAFPILYLIVGESYLNGTSSAKLDFIVEWLIPMIGTVIFWTYKSATPGKMLFSLKVLDANTSMPIGTGKAIFRYLSYMISAIPLGIGFIWIIFDQKHQGFHDKICSTIVVKCRSTKN